MENKNVVERQEDKLGLLQKELDKATAMQDTLQGKLDKAYAEMRDLASKTIESSRNFQIIGGSEKAKIE